MLHKEFRVGFHVFWNLYDPRGSFVGVQEIRLLCNCIRHGRDVASASVRLAKILRADHCHYTLEPGA